MEEPPKKRKKKAKKRQSTPSSSSHITTIPSAVDLLLDRRDSAEIDCPVSFEAPGPSVPPCSALQQAPIEAARLASMERLAQIFAERCAVLGTKKHFAHFEQWLWMARASPEAMRAESAPVPVLPARPSALAQAELRAKLEQGGMVTNEAAKVCDDLALHAAALDSQLAARSLAASSGGQQSGAKMSMRRDPRGDSHDGGGSDALVHLTCTANLPGAASAASSAATSLAVSEAHLSKLRAMFRPALARGGSRSKKRKRGGQAAAASQGSAPASARDGRVEAAAGEAAASAGSAVTAGAKAADDELFLAAAFCALSRVQSLQGGHEHAGGMQAASPGAVFDTLRTDFGVTVELFASPLNSHFLRFCSAAADVDAPFGSLGSFWSFSPRTGAFVANPPFEPLLIDAMARRMQSLLDAAERSVALLTFVVIVPTRKETPGWLALRGSSFQTAHVLLAHARHAFIDGGQHYGRRGRSVLRLSNHDTSVFFLQTARAAAAYPPSLHKQRRLAEAFKAGIGPNGQPDPSWTHPAPRAGL